MHEAPYGIYFEIDIQKMEGRDTMKQTASQVELQFLHELDREHFHDQKNRLPFKGHPSYPIVPLSATTPLGEVQASITLEHQQRSFLHG